MQSVLFRPRLRVPYHVPVALVRGFARLAIALPLALRLAWLEWALQRIGGGHPGASELIIERSQLEAAMRQGARATARVLAVQCFADAWRHC